MSITKPMFWLFGLTLGFQQELGIIFVQEWKNAGQTIISTTQMDGGRLRQESGMGTDHEVQIFDGIEHALRTLNPASKTYLEDTKESIGEGVQRALADSQAATYLYRKIGVGQVAQWPCTIYEVFHPEASGALTKDSEICLTELNQFKLTTSDLSISRDLYEFAWRYSLLPYGTMLAHPPRFPLTEIGDLSGVPVRRVWFTSDGSVATTSELKEFRREIISPSTFEVPENFAKLNASNSIDLPR